MHALHAAAPPDSGVPDLRELGRGLRRGTCTAFRTADHSPEHWVTTAARLFDDLCDSAPDRVLLHGDLHHDNVLRAARRPWLAIDPHGHVGDPGFDLGTLLYNPDPGEAEPDVLALLPSRLAQLTAGSGQPRDRVIGWCFVMAVLSEVWTCEDGGEPDGKPLVVAHALHPLL